MKTIHTIFASALVLFVSLALSSHTQAAMVSFVGGQEGGQVVDWRTSTTAKTFDLNGDNIYGTLAAINFTEAFLGIQGAGSSTLGVAFIGSGSQFISAGYSDIDSLLSAPANTDAGIAVPDFTFELTGTAADYAGKTVRVGVMEDVLTSAEYANDQFKGFRLQQTVGGTGDSGIISLRGGGPGNGIPEMYFFDITGAAPGNRFVITGLNNIGGTSGQSGYVSAVSWDLFTIPEPSTLMLFGLGGLLVWWRRRAARATVSVIAVAVVFAGSAHAATLILDLRADQGVSTSGSLVDSWADQSGQANNVTGTGGGRPSLVSSTLNGITKPAIEFNNAHKLVGASTSAFDFGTGDFTMIAVVNLFTQNGGGDRILGNLQNSGGFPGFMLDAGLTVGKVAGVYRNDPTGAQTTITDPNAFPVNSAVTVFGSERTGGTTLNFYRNGSLVTTAGIGAGVAVNGDAITIGAERTGGGEFLAGRIYEVRIYSGTFSAGQLAAIQTDLLNTWTQVPEPSTIALIVVGGLSLAWWRRQRRAL